MKKVLFTLFILFLLIGCSQKQQATEDDTGSSEPSYVAEDDIPETQQITATEEDLNIDDLDNLDEELENLDW